VRTKGKTGWYDMTERRAKLKALMRKRGETKKKTKKWNGKYCQVSKKVEKERKKKERRKKESSRKQRKTNKEKRGSRRRIGLSTERSLKKNFCDARKKKKTLNECVL
jgi:hypothetical protein